MPFTIVEGTTRYLHVIWKGEVTNADFARLREEMPKRCVRYLWQRRILHTFDEVTTCSFKPIEALDHSMKRKQLYIPVKVRVASVAKNEMIRQHAALVQEPNRNPYLIMETFSTDEAAIAWLLNGKRN